MKKIAFLFPLFIISCATKPSDLSHDGIRLKVRAHLSQIQSCYQKALKDSQKDLNGKITVGWEINDQGTAQNVKIKSDTVGSPELNICVTNTIEQIKFPPAPVGQTAEIIRYPFVFTNKAASIQENQP